MKKLLLLLLPLFILLSCNRNNSPEVTTDLVGTWLLKEVLADPGDGSGTFMAVDSDKTMAFYSDGTVTSNGLLCDLSITSSTPSSGIYNVVESTFRTGDCNFPEFDYQYTHTGTELIVHYFCIEACSGKFIKQ